jgi:biotin carboxylase
LREVLTRAGLRQPGFWLFETQGRPEEHAKAVRFPCVLKPVFLSASRGVIRTNNAAEFVTAFKRIKKLLSHPKIASVGGESSRKILAEEYIPGIELALEGLLIRGELSVLALFDKPDPLEGPFFEETIYVTPSRLTERDQKTIADAAARAARAMDLREGPVHVELRLNDRGPWLIEVASRSIGGLCSRMLRFGAGVSLEELILRHALGLPIESLKRENRASGVMMIPVPAGGILTKVNGLGEAGAVSGIEGVRIMIPVGRPVVPLPEGNRYLGFIFARGDAPDRVESSLREAHRRLEFTIESGGRRKGPVLNRLST